MLSRRPRDWLAAIDHSIRGGNTARSLELGTIWGFGDFRGGELRGLITSTKYDEDPRLWEVVISATDLRWTGCGVARGLKGHLLDKVRGRGVLAVVPHVHRDNEIMLGLNRSLGAFIKPDPNDAERELYFCTIDPQAPRPVGAE